MQMSYSNLYSLLILYCSKVINEERERENDREMALHSATKWVCVLLHQWGQNFTFLEMNVKGNM